MSRFTREDEPVGAMIDRDGRSRFRRVFFIRESEVSKFAVATLVIGMIAWICFCGWVGYQHGRAGDEAWLDNLLNATSVSSHLATQSLLFDH